jgi:hypothetical protein
MSDEEKPPLPESPPESPAESPAGGKPRTAPPLTQLNRPQRPPSSPTSEDGGPSGPEPTRYNDWERKGRVSDF